jgi:hypothetical protein
MRSLLLEDAALKPRLPKKVDSIMMLKVKNRKNF